jgi:mannosylglycoprotein endo-beta-mannosidase
MRCNLILRSSERRTGLLTLLVFLLTIQLFGQQIEELNSGWFCKNVQEVETTGEEITGKKGIENKNWLPAVVPGTVLTTLLENGKIPNPFIGMNNDEIPDIYDTGRAHYTYWFYKEFEVASLEKDEQFWLIFRGVNYSCDVFLNGEKISPKTHSGMFLRQKYLITNKIKEGSNRLAVLVHPPDPVGNPNGGQGGDGEIAKNVMHQYVAGWDWIQPVRDRNTGIWDKVFLERTGKVDIRNPHVVTLVPGKRYPNKKQNPAAIRVTAELMNTGEKEIECEVIINIDGQVIKKHITLPPTSVTFCEMPEISISDPKLWWPNGYGNQVLYDLSIQCAIDNVVSDSEKIKVGIREIQTEWNAHTKSMQIYVN